MPKVPFISSIERAVRAAVPARDVEDLEFSFDLAGHLRIQREGWGPRKIRRVERRINASVSQPLTYTDKGAVGAFDPSEIRDAVFDLAAQANAPDLSLSFDLEGNLYLDSELLSEQALERLEEELHERLADFHRVRTAPRDPPIEDSIDRALARIAPEVDPSTFEFTFDAAGRLVLFHDELEETELSRVEQRINADVLSPTVYDEEGTLVPIDVNAIHELVTRLGKRAGDEEMRFTFDTDGWVNLYSDALDEERLESLERQLARARKGLARLRSGELVIGGKKRPPTTLVTVEEDDDEDDDEDEDT